MHFTGITFNDKCIPDFLKPADKCQTLLGCFNLGQVLLVATLKLLDKILNIPLDRICVVHLNMLILLLVSSVTTTGGSRVQVST